MSGVEVRFHGAAGTVPGSCFQVDGGAKPFLVDCGMFQGTAALLVVLGEEVCLLGLFFTLEGGQGDFQRFTDFRRRFQGEADAKDQRHVQGGREKQGEPQAIRRSDGGGGGVRWGGCCVHRVSGLPSNVAQSAG